MFDVNDESAYEKVYEELLDLMVRTGMDAVMVGFESVNDETLALWHKSSTLEKNREAIERFHAKGIFIHGMFVLGSDADTVETIDQTTAFAKKMNLDTAQFFAITPIPGPPLTEKLDAEGRILTRDWHLYDAQHVVIQPRRMSAGELQDGLSRAFREFYSPREAIRRLFVNGPERLHNCMIRFMGRRLVKRVIKETEPYRSDLDRIREWLAAAEETLRHYQSCLSDLRERAGRKSAHLSDALDRRINEWTEGKDRFLAGFEERMASLKEGLAHLGESYQPFCRRVLEDLRRCFLSECEAVPAQVAGAHGVRPPEGGH